MNISIRRAKPFLQRNEYSILKKYTKELSKLSVSKVADDFDTALNNCDNYIIIKNNGVNIKNHSDKVIDKVKCPIFLHSISSNYRLIALLNNTELYVITNEDR